MNSISSNRFVEPIYRPRPVSGYQYTGERLSKAIKEGRKKEKATEITEDTEKEESWKEKTVIKKATEITEKEERTEKKTEERRKENQVNMKKWKPGFFPI